MVYFSVRNLFAQIRIVERMEPDALELLIDNISAHPGDYHIQDDALLDDDSTSVACRFAPEPPLHPDAIERLIARNDFADIEHECEQRLQALEYVDTSIANSMYEKRAQCAKALTLLDDVQRRDVPLLIDGIDCVEQKLRDSIALEQNVRMLALYARRARVLRALELCKAMQELVQFFKDQAVNRLCAQNLFPQAIELVFLIHKRCSALGMRNVQCMESHMQRLEQTKTNIVDSTRIHIEYDLVRDDDDNEQRLRACITALHEHCPERLEEIATSFCDAVCRAHDTLYAMRYIERAIQWFPLESDAQQRVLVCAFAKLLETLESSELSTLLQVYRKAAPYALLIMPQYAHCLDTIYAALGESIDRLCADVAHAFGQWTLLDADAFPPELGDMRDGTMVVLSDGARYAVSSAMPRILSIFAQYRQLVDDAQIEAFCAFVRSKCQLVARAIVEHAMQSVSSTQSIASLCLAHSTIALCEWLAMHVYFSDMLTEPYSAPALRHLEHRIAEVAHTRAKDCMSKESRAPRHIARLLDETLQRYAPAAQSQVVAEFQQKLVHTLQHQQGVVLASEPRHFDETFWKLCDAALKSRASTKKRRDISKFF